MIKIHSMTIHDRNSDKKTPAVFVFGRYYRLYKAGDLEKIMEKMRDLTYIDGRGRILCSGDVEYTMESQHRLFVVKRSHGTKGELYETFGDYPYKLSPLGQVVRLRLLEKRDRS
jgi:hypothetical protein